MEIIATIIFILLYSIVALLYFLIPIFLYHCFNWLIVRSIIILSMYLFHLNLGPAFWAIYISIVIVRFLFTSHEK